jgi:hypothetical protein
VNESTIDKIEPEIMQKVETFSVKPLDLGLSFAWSCRWLILAIALVTAALESGLSYIILTRPIDARILLLVSIAQSAAKAWVLIFVAGLALIAFHTSDLLSDVSELALKAIKVLPKTLISYLFVLFIVASTVVMVYTIPLLYFMLFLIWVPIFIAFEAHAVSVVEPKKNIEDDFFEVDDEEVVEKELKRREKFFQNKLPWELGLARAAQFTLGKKYFTLQIVLLLVFASVVPACVVTLIVGDTLGFVSEFMKIFASNFFEVFFAAAVSMAFVLLLPQRALNELRIAKKEIGLVSRSFKGKSPISLQDNLWSIIAITCLTTFSAYYLYSKTIEQQQVPPSASIVVASVNAEPHSVFITVNLDDPKNYLRWLDAKNFKIKLADAPIVEKTTKENVEESINEFKLVRALPYLTKTDQALNPEFYVPSRNPITLVLEFTKPKELSPNTKIALYYETPIGLGSPLYQGVVE